MMGGEIALDSEPGRGSTFSFSVEVPIVPVPVMSETSQLAANDLRLDGTKVLVAEDNEVNLRLVTRLLEKFGALVVGVGNGQDALRKLRQDRFDIVLMDIQMPGMSGVEVLSQVRQENHGLPVPIIALTAHAMPQDRDRYLGLGFSGYLSKPISPSELVRTVSEHLQRATLLA